ncbi:MAG: protein-L-isoaspartate(D-aspartate) O-methyltransferase [SAR202 cluster bacterium]|nr:protein-L-isoaspartate(D-aspartate) O-methyltransferase [SAR202 cluster bacterium]
MNNDLSKAKEALFRSLRSALGGLSESVLQAIQQVPRERFVPPESRHMAYLDIPLAIGAGQTISQPYIVALMTQALELRGTERVLELGTGSGYQAAIISRLVPQGSLVTVERVPELADRARAVLKELGYANVTVELAGPTLGSPGRAPFDAIIVTAAAPRLPPSLVDQLAPGGRLVIPVGSRDMQELVQARRTDEGLSLRMLGPCRFVPLLGPEPFPEE